MSAPEYTNRLVHESSPYLLQHAHNPVDWYPWGPEALEQARRADKPILVSIGYAACHWCHVMEHESFEDPDTAALMNEHFINIKVDREERPDIDTIYMTAVQAMTGQGGWPLNMFLLPDGTPAACAASSAACACPSASCGRTSGARKATASCSTAGASPPKR